MKNRNANDDESMKRPRPHDKRPSSKFKKTQRSQAQDHPERRPVQDKKARDATAAAEEHEGLKAEKRQRLAEHVARLWKRKTAKEGIFTYRTVMAKH
jgi:hypothetical protein